MDKIKNNNGFTLLEVLIVLAITGIFTGSLVLSFSSFEKRSLKKYTLEIKQDIRYTQRLAMAESTRAKITFDVDQSLYRVYKYTGSSFELVKTVHLSDNIKIRSINAAGNKIEFTSRGTTGDACSIRIYSPGYAQVLTVNVGSGRVDIKELEKSLY